MTQEEREIYLLGANREITRLLNEPVPDQTQIDLLRAERDVVCLEYAALGGERWCGNA